MIIRKENDSLFEMANVSKDDTGLPYTLWIDSLGSRRKTGHNDPRLKVEVNGNRIPVSISKNPEILVNKKINNFGEVRDYIIRYYDVFIKHWRGELTDRQALDMLNK